MANQDGPGNGNNLFRNDDNDAPLENRVGRMDDTDLKLLGEALRENYGRIAETVGHGIADAARACGRAAVKAVKANAMPYIMPTFLRKYGDQPIPRISELESGAILFGYFAQMCVYTGLVFGGSDPNGYTDSHMEYLLIPVATNLIDGLIYEPIRKSVVDARQRRAELYRNNDIQDNRRE